MSGKIDCYIDLASFYSYLIFLDLIKNRDLLASHGVQVEFHPVLLGAINAGSGNKPPWTLPAKASYGLHDARRSMARFPGLDVQFPADLFSVSHTVLPLRALHYIKHTHTHTHNNNNSNNNSAAAFEATLHHLFRSFWEAPNVDLTRPENLAEALSSVPAGDGTGKLFSGDEVRAMMQGAASREMKEALRATTQQALERGAFGAPWLWVTDGAGKAEPFFGSDRFHFVYKFLGLPFQDVALLPPPPTGRGDSGAGKPKL